MRAAFLFLGLLLSRVSASDGANPCYDRCLSGTSIVNLYGCQLTNSDLPQLERCFDEVGRDNIQYVYLSSNELTTLSAGLFDGLGSLRLALLNDNKLNALPAGLFDGLGNLQYLYLMNNELTTLPEGLFDDLGSVSDLFLQGNPDLQCVPTNVATNVKTDGVYFGQCECTPDEAVLCNKGFDCVAGESGYTCESAVHKAGVQFNL